MSTDLATKAKPTNAPAVEIISFVPIGETTEINLTVAKVRKYLCIPTKSGKMPTDEQVMKFIMLARSQSLNPWTQDCWLTGYDSKDGPQFSLITAHSAMLKRAEASPTYDGMESGVIVASGETITERQGDLILNGEVLVGGWARVHRRDRKIPSYDALNFSTFDTGYSRWKIDPAGMIVKCAEASALRKAFPSTLAAMYCREEMDRARQHAENDGHSEDRAEDRNKSATAQLTERLLATRVDKLETTSDKQESHETTELSKEAEQRDEHDDKREEADHVATGNPPSLGGEPQRESNGRADNLSRRIHLATAGKDLAQLGLEVGEALAEKSLTQHEADALSGLIAEKMPK